jgi:hypothetical protein
MRSPGIRSQSFLSAFYVFSKPDGYRVSEFRVKRGRLAKCQALGILGLLVRMISTEFGMGNR